jgi:putative Mg2+ transporter-C (MgtC) family protein
MSAEDLSYLPRMLANLVAAFALALPVGWEREHRGLSPGLRTYPLLSMGACAFMQIGEHVFSQQIDSQARVFQALVSGIGFIGAGAIIKGRVEVYGLATAVSLWVTVAVGIAVAYELYVLGAVLSFTTLLALQALRPLKKTDHDDKRPRERAGRDG